MALTPLEGMSAGRRLSAEDERERETEDRERLGEREPQEGDRLQQATGLGLAGHAVDVGGEDQTDADAGADGRQAVAEDRDVAFHDGSFPSFDRRCWRRRWCERFPRYGPVPDAGCLLSVVRQRGWFSFGLLPD